jgi:hypothetical protein
MTDNQITITKHSTTFSGPDATRLFQAIALRSAMKLTAKTGILPRRGFTKTVMLQQVAKLTWKDYRLRDFDQAIADLSAWIDKAKASMPIVREG